MVRRVKDQVPEEELRQDLERYRQMALELGATDASVITADEVLIDERAQAKCKFPMCPLYGTNMNCPPYVMEPDRVQKLVGGFSYAIFFRLAVSSGQQADIDHAIKVKTLEIVSKIEAEAFYDGYYLAVGFGGSGCKDIFCADQECSALTPGQGCRYPYRARPAMHALGMDAYRMAVRQGWEMYPVGQSSKLEDIPRVSTMGLVLIY